MQESVGQAERLLAVLAENTPMEDRGRLLRAVPDQLADRLRSGDLSGLGPSDGAALSASVQRSWKGEGGWNVVLGVTPRQRASVLRVAKEVRAATGVIVAPYLTALGRAMRKERQGIFEVLRAKRLQPQWCKGADIRFFEVRSKLTRASGDMSPPSTGGAEFSDAERRTGFAVRFSADKGRHLVATRAFSPGALVLKQEPLAAVLYDEATPGHCDHCFAAVPRPLRCSRSRLARYCSREHQRAAWAAGFRAECEALVRCAPRVPPPTVRLAARILWRRARALEQGVLSEEVQGAGAGAGGPGAEGGEAGATPPAPHVHHTAPTDADAGALWRLRSHWARLDPRRKALYGQMAVVTWQYMFGSPDSPAPAPEEDPSSSPASPSPACGPDGDVPPAPAPWPGFLAAAQLLARLAANCHTVADEELRPLGAALYPTGALVNHSCTPSCAQAFRGATLQLRALRPLAPGDELTIAYTELAASRQERREALAEGYAFDLGGPGPGAAGPGEGAMEVDGAGPTGPTGPGAVGPTGPGGGGGGGGGQAGGEGAQGAGAAGPLVVRPPPLQSLELAPGAVLHLYGTYGAASAQPPWPTDPVDADFTRVVAVAGAEAAGGQRVGANGEGQGGWDLRGGLMAREVPRRPNEPEEEAEEEEDDDDDEGEEEEREGRAGGPAGGGGDVSMGEASGPGADAGGGRRPLALQLGPGRGRAGRRGDEPAAARPPRLELLAWGPWARHLAEAAAAVGGADGQEDAAGAPAAAPAVGPPGPGSAPGPPPPPGPAVADLLRRCVRALALAHGAAAAAADRCHTEAVTQLLQALALVEPPAPSPSAPPSPPALHLGPTHLLRLRLRGQLLKAAIDAASSGGPEGGAGGGGGGGGGGSEELWRLALETARWLEGPYARAYPGPAWPSLGLHRATLAKLEALAGNPRRALRAAAAALEGLRLTHVMPGGGGAGGGGGGGGGEGQGEGGEGVLQAMERVAREAEAELRMRAAQGAGTGAEEEED
ncbi:hypothetical protein HYH03_008228 [Edaphochlamys debaryana]|uniref:SET domain-containing protein n=1 Tax=Edaphochlamys debaryana TaxID=47281 RepID=A0A835Y784_9CHLO|nr:hypothetical protein HYH03_008228 [Edaphochlamys debaryana]|eukprot:KAG2493715.1 hypothetical protein HYH03_008228 [Edaphochlamys debaryana]